MHYFSTIANFISVSTVTLRQYLANWLAYYIKAKHGIK